MLHGVDVSNWQGAYKWPGSGLAFGFAKATEGTGFRDGQFARNWSQMRARGLVRGAYHFGHPKNSATREADFFVSVVRARGLRAGDLLALDLEVHDGRSPSAVAAWAGKWCRRVEAKTGVRPLVYTFVSFARGGYCAGLGKYPLWIAAPSYKAGHPPMPLGPWSIWAIHQHSDSPVDLDVSHLNKAQLRELGGDDVTAAENWEYPIPKGPDFPKEWRALTHLRYQTQTADQQLRELAALRASHGELVKALGNLAGLDADNLLARIDAAVRQALADATVSVDVDVHGDTSTAGA